MTMIRGRIKRSWFCRNFLNNQRLTSVLLLLVVTACGSFASGKGPADSPAVIGLSTDNYKRATNGRTVLLLFEERDCVVCRDVLHPVWERLAQEYNAPGGSGAMVARVDCTNPRGKVICDRFGVTVTPSILYGEPLDPKEYRGGYDHTSLSGFAKVELNKPVCHVRHLDACDESTGTLIGEFRSRSLDELLVEKDRIDATIKEHWGTTFSMTAQNAFVTQTEKETNYKWLQQILVEDHGVRLEESPFVWHEVAMDDDDFSVDFENFPDEREHDDEYFDADDEFFDEDEYEEEEYEEGDESLEDEL